MLIWWGEVLASFFPHTLVRRVWMSIGRVSSLCLPPWGYAHLREKCCLEVIPTPQRFQRNDEQLIIHTVLDVMITLAVCVCIICQNCCMLCETKKSINKTRSMKYIGDLSKGQLGPFSNEYHIAYCKLLFIHLVLYHKLHHCFNFRRACKQHKYSKYKDYLNQPWD